MEMEAQSESLRKRICLSGGIPGRSSFGGTKNAGVITAVPAPAAGFGGAGTCFSATKSVRRHPSRWRAGQSRAA